MSMFWRLCAMVWGTLVLELKQLSVLQLKCVHYAVSCFLPALFEGTDSRVNHWVFLKAACSAYFVLGSVAQVLVCRLRSSYSPLMYTITAFPHTAWGQSQKLLSLLAAESTRLHKCLLHTRQQSFHSQFGALGTSTRAKQQNKPIRNSLQWLSAFPQGGLNPWS